MSEPAAEPAGVLLVDKPQGITSHDVVDSVRRLYRTRRVGHAGTLDPMATGLLIVLVGKATKASDQLMAQDKEYLGEATLGVVTDTQDAEGETRETNPVPEITEAQVRAALASMVGDQFQVPPMHSAKKIGGQKLYDLARKGVEVVREPRAIRIAEFELLSWASPKIHFRVRCTKGTYVRTLAEDLGRLLGCGAHLSALRRTASGALCVEQAVTLDALEALDAAARLALLLPPDVLLHDWLEVRLPEDEAGRFLTGLRRRVALADRAAVRVYGPQPRAFLGSAHFHAGELIADRLLSPPEVQALVAGQSAP